jgi:hypothetical protein
MAGVRGAEPPQMSHSSFGFSFCPELFGVEFDNGGRRRLNFDCDPVGVGDAGIVRI